MAKKDRVISYTRDLEANKVAPYETKFAGLIRALAEAKAGGCDCLLIAEPSIIGDTHEEMVESLSRLAEADVALRIVERKRTPWKN